MKGSNLFNSVIRGNLITNRKYLKGRSRYIPAYTEIYRNIGKTERLRAEVLETEGLTVPPILIMSVTNRCNLQCRGCYACAQDRDTDDEMTLADIDRITAEAVEAGVGIVFIAGGEPLLKEGILDIPRKYGSTLFVMFTNGTLIDRDTADSIAGIRNLVPAFSLEGDEAATDARRGAGVYRSIRSAMEMLDRGGIMFGASITLTRQNYSMVTDPSYLAGLDSAGCRALFLIEYVPCEGDPGLCLTEQQKADLLELVPRIMRDCSMLPIALPGNEEKYGGCLAAGRGFLHVSSSGAVEACPFAPYSDVNLKELSFRDALRSRLLGRIRENHHLLEEAEGGCTLFENREWVEKLSEETLPV